MGDSILFPSDKSKAFETAGVETPFPVSIYGSMTSLFGELRTVEKTPIVELKSIYGPSLLRDVVTTASGGSVALDNGEIRLRTGTSATGQAQVDSAEKGRYVPGFGGELGIGTRLPDLPTGEQSARWGLRGNGEGLYFGVDADGVFVAKSTGSVETKTYQSDWNTDKMDGTGPSGATLDLSDGNIFQIAFSWYGYGQVIYGLTKVIGNKQNFLPCHTFVPVGGLSLKNPNLPIYAEVENGGTSTSFDMYLGGRQYSVVGKYVAKYRLTGQERGPVSTSTTAVPLVSLRGKTDSFDRSLLFDSYSVVAQTENHVLELRLNGTLTGASYGTPTNHTASETGVEADTSATAISGGVVIWSDLIPGGGNNTRQAAAANSNGLALDLPEGQALTLCARTVTGTGSITSHMSIAEEW